MFISVANDRRTVKEQQNKQHNISQLLSLLRINGNYGLVIYNKRIKIQSSIFTRCYLFLIFIRTNLIDLSVWGKGIHLRKVRRTSGSTRRKGGVGVMQTEYAMPTTAVCKAYIMQLTFKQYLT